MKNLKGYIQFFPLAFSAHIPFNARSVFLPHRQIKLLRHYILQLFLGVAQQSKRSADAATFY